MSDFNLSITKSILTKPIGAWEGEASKLYRSTKYCTGRRLRIQTISFTRASYSVSLTALSLGVRAVTAVAAVGADELTVQSEHFRPA